MVRVEVELAAPYAVEIGAGVLAGAARAASGASSVAVLADERAAQLHGSKLIGLERAPRLELPRGEAAKDLRTLERALDFLSGARLDRASVVYVLGGGAACDLGGLAASLYMRGIAAVYCPTTLLAQVDASVGGKTAINLAAGKNLAGTFHQPRAVFADVATLATLDESEYRSGLGEVLKTAVIEGEGLFARVEVLAEELLARDPEALAEIVAACVRTKARIVVSDERESGPRKQLNLGHTFAHAIEHAAGYGAVPHGIAVACGLVLALETARERGSLRDPGLVERVGALLARLRLPRSLAELRRERALSADALLEAMRGDKKSRAGEVRLVLPRALGEIEVDVAATEDELRRRVG